MATQMESHPFVRFTVPSRTLPRLAFLRLLSPLIILFSVISQVSAQTSTQQYVYLSLPGSPPSSPSSLISAFNKAGQTGALTSVSGSPFTDRLEGGLVAIDGQGKFLFILNPTSNDVSMFQIDQASGALSEVPGSPFAVPPAGTNPALSRPISMSAEPSGKFLFVGFFNGDLPGNSAIVSLAINTSGSAPALSTVQILDMLAAPLQLLTDPKGLHLYVGLTQGPNGIAAGGAEVFSIDSATGQLGDVGTADSLPNNGVSYAIDPQDRFFFATGHDFVQSCAISPVDGTANTCTPLLFLDPTDTQAAMVAESSGKFVYLCQSGASPGVVVYSLDQTTGALAQVLGPLSGVQFANGSAVADPMGPYLYSAQFAAPTVIHAYQVDSQTGNLTEIPGSPFSAGASANCCGGLAISGNPTQAVSGPAVSIFPSSATFSSVVGVTSPTQVFSIVNTGGQLLAISSISITGANASSFSQTNTCLATLAPNANCSVSINFTPATVGALTANLQVADNAPGSPQTLVLNGTGVAPAPAITFSPTALTFPSVNQGTSTAPQTLTVISSGNAALNISSVSLAGPNPSDFSFTNNCTAPLAPGSNCAISLVFTPTAAGQRVANLMIADDATGSPQTVVLSGTGIAVLPALSFSPSSPSFPATTQGTSSAPQSISVINSGNAPLQISSVSLGGSSASEFSLTSNCAASLAPAASCTVSLVFSPVATGQSAAMLTVTDDAPGSPQSASISGMAVAAFSVAPASGGSTSASVSAGQSAQYQLQLTPGSGFSGTVALSCSGAPLGAVCQVPASVSLANGTANFHVTVTTSGPAAFPPSLPLRMPPLSRVPFSAPIFLALLFFLLAFFNKHRQAFQPAARKNRLAFCAVFFVAIFCTAFVFAGCGGGSAAVTPPPPIVTPSGTSTITISLSATSSTGQPLQLQPIQLTLTVK